MLMICPFSFCRAMNAGQGNRNGQQRGQPSNNSKTQNGAPRLNATPLAPPGLRSDNRSTLQLPKIGEEAGKVHLPQIIPSNKNQENGGQVTVMGQGGGGGQMSNNKSDVFAAPGPVSNRTFNGTGSLPSNRFNRNYKDGKMSFYFNYWNACICIDSVAPTFVSRAGWSNIYSDTGLTFIWT